MKPNLVTPNSTPVATSQSHINNTCDFSLHKSENGNWEPILKTHNPNPKCIQLLHSMRAALVHEWRMEISTRNIDYSGDPDK